LQELQVQKSKGESPCFFNGKEALKNQKNFLSNTGLKIALF
jgi:hypothetical protein